MHDRRLTPLRLLMPACFLAVGCSGDRPSDAKRATATWTVSATPNVRIGADYDFGAIVGATRLPDGTFMVGDVGEYALHKFAATGEPLQKYARKGKGPGEVTRLFALYRCGGSLFTWDGGGSRVSEFTFDGAYVREFRFAELPYRSACNAAGTFIHMGWERNSEMKQTAYRSTSRYYITPSDSTAGVSLGRMPGAERWGNFPLPLGRDSRVAISETQVYLAFADSLHIRVFDLAGNEQPALRAHAERVPTTRADFDAELERQVAMFGENARRMLVESYSQMELPQTLPATRDLLVDVEGDIWVQHFPRAKTPTTTWTVFAPEGDVRTTLELPIELEIFEIGRDYILGRFLGDGTTMPEVRMYALTRGR